MKIKNHEISLIENPSKAISMTLATRINKDPVMVNLLLNSSVIKDTNEGIAYTTYHNGESLFNIHVNYEFLENIEKHYQINAEWKSYYLLFILYHEITHHILKHFSRTKIRESQKKYPNLVNSLIDYHVNYFVSTMIKESSTEFITKTGGIDYYMLDDIRKNLNIQDDLPFAHYEPPMIEEQLIQWFLERADKKSLEEEFGKVVLIGDHGKFECEEVPGDDEGMKRMLLDAKVNVMMNDAEVSKSMGKGSELFQRWLEINKKDPYLDFIQVDATMRSLTRGKDRRTYSRINRHHPFSQIIRKGSTPDTMPPLVVLIDCSYSITDKELMKFNEIMGGYVDKGGTLEVIYWSDCEISESNFHRNITSWEEVRKLRPESSGGTEIEYVFDFISKEYEGEMVTICVITDGYWIRRELPKNVAKSYFVLTEQSELKEIQDTYPGSIVKMIKVD